MLGHTLIYFYEEKKKVLPSSFNDDSQMTEAEIAMHSLMITGINRELSTGWVFHSLDKFTSFNSEEMTLMEPLTGDPPITKRVIGDFKKMLSLLQQLEKTEK